MFLCCLCHFEFTLDDLALAGAQGMAVCLRCYERETGARHPAVRKDVVRAINEEEPIP